MSHGYEPIYLEKSPFFVANVHFLLCRNISDPEHVYYVNFCTLSGSKTVPQTENSVKDSMVNEKVHIHCKKDTLHQKK